MNNHHKRNAEALTQTQVALLHYIEKNVLVEFPPFFHNNDADRLFDLHWLLAVEFIEIEIAESNPHQKLQVRLSLAGSYAARSILPNDHAVR